MEVRNASTCRVDIFMAGDIQRAKQICREHCMEVGLCVHIEPVSFIYTGGEEDGFKVGLINYPRFPSDAEAVREKAELLAEALMRACCQHSYTIVDDVVTTWHSRRAQTVAGAA